MTIEIVSFPIKNVVFPELCNKLPEGTYHFRDSHRGSELNPSGAWRVEDVQSGSGPGSLRVGVSETGGMASYLLVN